MGDTQALFSARDCIARLWSKRHGDPALRRSLRRLIRLTKEARPYEPWEDCPTCDGCGSVDGGWVDDDDSYDRDEAVTL